MGSIFSGVGLISGIDIQSLVDRLIALDGRSRDQLVTRTREIDAQKTAFLDVSARVAALLGRVSGLTTRSAFEVARANSSDESVLTASATPGTASGSYSFVVRSLAATHQLVSRGFARRDSTVLPGQLTIESAQARVNRDTELAQLNGYAGVQRGKFKLIDGSGKEAVIDVADALTLDEVVKRINGAGLTVRAQLEGEALKLVETSGGELRVREVDGGRVAADLGFPPDRAFGTGEITGRELIYLSNDTPLAGLNDGLGVRRSRGGGDFTIQHTGGAEFSVDLSDVLRDDTRLERLNHGRGVEVGKIRIQQRSGLKTEIDLAGARTIGDVKKRIEDQTDGVVVVIANNRLVITDSSSVPTDQTPLEFKLEDVSGHSVRDLALGGPAVKDKIDGRGVLFIETIGDALNAINFAAANFDGNGNRLVEARVSADGQRLELFDQAGGTGRLILKDGSVGSQALRDLGFQAGTYGLDGGTVGRRIIGGIDSVLLSNLNGGQGFSGGVFEIALGGQSVSVDVTGAETLRDVLDTIKARATEAGLAIDVDYDRTGTGLQISAGDAVTPLTIRDLSGNFAAALGLDQTGPSIRSDNLQRRYVNENTALSSLNNGAGVALGRLKLTNSKGLTSFVDLGTAQPKTIKEAIDAINSQAVGVRARINDTGDGLLLEDAAGGELALKVEEDGGTVGRDLNLIGEARDGRIDGSFEYKLDLAANETLIDVVARINKIGLASATIVNDGTGYAPFRLSLAARTSGSLGELIVDGDAAGLDFSTLTKASDARIFFGGSGAGGALVTSSSNTLTNVVDGLSITLTGVSEKPVELTVNRDNSTVIETVGNFVSDFNTLVDRIAELDSYDPETEQQGVLFGESTLRTIESRLIRSVTGSVTASGNIRRLSQLGITLDRGEKLSIDAEKFKQALEERPDDVIQFFTAAATGFATGLKDKLDDISGDGGLIDRRTDSLDDRKKLLTDRIAQLNSLLDRKRERLVRQFQAMEQALATLQGQQAALGSFGSGSTAATSG